MTQPFQASLLKFSTKFLLIKAQFYWYSRQAMVIADQCVKIGDSMQTLCKSGVPQKSVFGPLLLSFSQTLKLSSNDKPNTASPHYQADNKIISLGTLHQLYFHSDQACSFPLSCPCYQCSNPTWTTPLPQQLHICFPSYVLPGTLMLKLGVLLLQLTPGPHLYSWVDWRNVSKVSCSRKQQQHQSCHTRNQTHYLLNSRLMPLPFG